MSTLTVELSDELASRLDNASSRLHVAPSELIKTLIERHLPLEGTAHEKRAALEAFLREWSGAGRRVMTDEEIRSGYLSRRLASQG
jgi:predicted transcriptional regulator